MRLTTYMNVVGMHYVYEHAQSVYGHGGGNMPRTRLAWQSFRLEVRL